MAWRPARRRNDRRDGVDIKRGRLIRTWDGSRISRRQPGDEGVFVVFHLDIYRPGARSRCKKAATARGELAARGSMIDSTPTRRARWRRTQLEDRKEDADAMRVFRLEGRHSRSARLPKLVRRAMCSSAPRKGSGRDLAPGHAPRCSSRPTVAVPIEATESSLSLLVELVGTARDDALGSDVRVLWSRNHRPLLARVEAPLPARRQRAVDA